MGATMPADAWSEIVKYNTMQYQMEEEMKKL
jgi:hypothetical protein